MYDLPVSMDEPVADEWLPQFAAALLQEPYQKILRNTERLNQKHKLKTKRVHATRIELRRLRTHLSNCRVCFSTDDYELVKAALKNYNQVLAATREMDVFMLELSHRMMQSYTQNMHRGLSLLADRIIYKRQDLNTALMEANHILLTSEGWGILGHFLENSGDDHSPVFAQTELDMWMQTTIAQHVAGIMEEQSCLAAEMPGEAFHQLRISLKELRYTLEDFGKYHPEFLDSIIRYLKPIQDCMGMIHDRQMWLDAVDVFVAESEAAETSEEDHQYLMQVLALFRQEWQMDVIDQYHAFQKLWQYLDRDGFWESLNIN